ncbi:hypothetical protein GOA99_20320 [Sinorhizobium meliloti]|nr:hypothetical protein [Sinorhizobium meliloti]MDX0506239.1 hypothetical protein [Sinorhizobium medicae]MDX0590162.1 hypothetical protein [Sinorhizobium medicae]MDX0808598.1 hypothetical protein [Sinorhizobium medicae]MDX2385069.1 hypothetical protein [Sinorhizobium medicae]
MQQPAHPLLSSEKIKVTFADLKAKGVVRHRRDLFLKIQAGLLPRPQKNTSSPKSGAWWWAADIDAALLRERRLTADE